MSRFRFESRVPEVVAGMDDGIDRVLSRIALDWSGHAKQAVPVDTGRLRASITWSTPSYQATVTPIGAEPFTPPPPPPYTVQVGTNVEYGPAVHEGIPIGKSINVPRHTVKAHARKTKRGTVLVRSHERGPYTFLSRGRNPKPFIAGPGAQHAPRYQQMIRDALAGKK